MTSAKARCSYGAAGGCLRITRISVPTRDEALHDARAQHNTVRKADIGMKPHVPAVLCASGSG